ncbi:hypothetical protein GSI_03629 [Ganoderma sinense ZZ0214-1]|uniref:Uncharacterized protein n=1 Tax=Ganoderma sinense ZZ0214-1 TaxID=1077348 RepID=A0A2G8SJH6_9APHY|nr:hypothetical protein GSI_03629 [Ganoderma sinense ZZ0214-1]
MLFPTTTHPGRQRSSVSNAALGRPSRRTVFVYSSNAGYARGTLRTLLVGGLRTFSGDDSAKMGYTPRTFRDNVLFPYHAKLPGWPSRIRFCNLSARGAPSPAEMLELIHLIRTGVLRFEEATPDDILAAQLDVANAVPGTLFHAPLPNVARRDIGSRKPRFDENGEVIPPRYERNGPKSAAWIDEEEGGEDAGERAGLRPITMWKDGFRCVLEGGSWSVMDGADGDEEEEEEEEDAISDWD